MHACDLDSGQARCPGRRASRGCGRVSRVPALRWGAGLSLSAAITIITPTLNAEAYLTECLTSVSAQQIDGLQHIVVDGGSTDRTGEIVFAHPDVQWVSEPGLRQ